MKYKNLTDQDLVISNVGFVKAHGEIETSVKIENPNLELVSSDQPQPQTTAPVQPVTPPVSAPAGEVKGVNNA